MHPREKSHILGEKWAESRGQFSRQIIRQQQRRRQVRKVCMGTSFFRTFSLDYASNCTPAVKILATPMLTTRAKGHLFPHAPPPTQMSRGHQLNHITANSMVYMSLCPCNCPHPNPYNTKNATFSHDEQNCSFLKLRLSCTFSHITSCYFSFHGTYKGKLSAFKRTLNICKSLYHTICSQLC